MSEEYKYSFESLEPHWRDLIFNLCASIAAVDILDKYPTEEEFNTLEEEEVTEKANEVFMRAIFSLEKSYEEIAKEEETTEEIVH